MSLTPTWSDMFLNMPTIKTLRKLTHNLCIYYMLGIAWTLKSFSHIWLIPCAYYIFKNYHTFQRTTNKLTRALHSYKIYSTQTDPYLAYISQSSAHTFKNSSTQINPYLLHILISKIFCTKNRGSANLIYMLRHSKSPTHSNCHTFKIFSTKAVPKRVYLIYWNAIHKLNNIVLTNWPVTCAYVTYSNAQAYLLFKHSHTFQRNTNWPLPCAFHTYKIYSTQTDPYVASMS